MNMLSLKKNWKEIVSVARIWVKYMTTDHEAHGDIDVCNPSLRKQASVEIADSLETIL